MEVRTEFPKFKGTATDIDVVSYCEYTVSIYPTTDFEDAFQDGTPVIYMCGVLGVFLLTSLVFIAYDQLVQRLKKKVVTSAERSKAIINTLFPQEVQDRLVSCK